MDMAKHLNNGHGGNIHAASAALKKPLGDIIDFSASINPLGAPKSALSALASAAKTGIVHYPDPDCAGLKSAISRTYGLDKERIICSNGSTELIYLIPRALRPKTVLIPGPTFSEYERAAIISGAKVRHLALGPNNDFSIDAATFIDNMRDCDMAFVCNPANPNGLLTDKNTLVEILNAAKKHNCMLVMDEAFIEFCDDAKSGSLINRDESNLIVLRSLTKYFAMPGIRIGFGVFPRRLVNNIIALKEPWSVNSLAQAAAAAALSDEEYKRKTRIAVDNGKRYMESALTGLGMRFYKSDVNYYLLKTKHAPAIINGLFKQGIIVRDCKNFRGLDRNHIRIAVRSMGENKTLINAMKGILDKC